MMNPKTITNINEDREKLERIEARLREKMMLAEQVKERALQVGPHYDVYTHLGRGQVCREILNEFSPEAKCGACPFCELSE